MTELLAEDDWLMKGFDISLRLPFLLLIDEKLKSDFSLWGYYTILVEGSLEWSEVLRPLHELLCSPLLERAYYFLEWGFALVYLYTMTFATSTKDLISTYSHMGSLFLPFVSLGFNAMVLSSPKDTFAYLNLLLQFHLAQSTSLLCVPGLHCLWGRPLYVLYIFTPVLAMLEPPPILLGLSLGITTTLFFLNFAQKLNRALEALEFFKQIYARKGNFIHIFGINVFLEAEWTRLSFPALLRSFWMLRLLYNIGEFLLVERPFFEAESLEGDYAFALGKFILIKGCETFWAVLGMAAILSSLCQLIDGLFRCILSVDDSSTSRTVASVSPFLFFVLALQTGLTTLEPDKRLSRLLMNLCLLLTAIFHLIHDMVAPVLVNLTIQQNFERRKHLRALFTSLFLMGSASSLLVYLWDSFSCGTWLFAVSAFCIELIIKMLISLLIYALYLYDQFGTENWESFDDVVYAVKALGYSIEFFFAVCLFLNGGWIFFFESRGAVRAIMMGIHAYFNIWCEAINGWKSFRKRRTASTKLGSLHLAPQTLLRSRDDVCAICLMEMKVARVTSCDHLFHSHCLQRWIYVENSCPLCKTLLFGEDGALLQGERAPLPDERPQVLMGDSSPPSSDEDEIIYDAVDNYEEEDEEQQPLMTRLRRIRN